MKSKQQQKYLHTHLCWVTLREANTQLGNEKEEEAESTSAFYAF